MGRDKLVSGVWAALRTPRRVDGSLDEGAFAAQVEFLTARGIGGVVLNGATGEYPLATVDELKVLSSALRGVAFLCGIGAGSLHGSVAAGLAAMKCGARGLLLPMPYFFPYAQGDLREFCRRLAGLLADAPILLYNLPHFTSPIVAETVAGLVAECPNILGIKDSGGTLEIVRALPETACRVIGDDSVLVRALREDVCDGVISGVANVLPELQLRIFGARGQNETDNRRLDEFIAQLSVFPTPWGVKLAAEFLGLGKAEFGQPLSTERQAQAEAFRRWFAGWA